MKIKKVPSIENLTSALIKKDSIIEDEMNEYIDSAAPVLAKFGITNIRVTNLKK